MDYLSSSSVILILPIRDMVDIQQGPNSFSLDRTWIHASLAKIILKSLIFARLVQWTHKDMAKARAEYSF